MTERNFMARVMLDAPQHGACLYRNNVGVFRGLYSDRKIRCGLCPGSADLIGYITLNGVAVFLAVETKAKHGRASATQLAFLESVRRAGGIGFVITEGQDLGELLRKEIERWSGGT